jgi:hypothetical protein
MKRDSLIEALALIRELNQHALRVSSSHKNSRTLKRINTLLKVLMDAEQGLIDSHAMQQEVSKTKDLLEQIRCWKITASPPPPVEGQRPC